MGGLPDVAIIDQKREMTAIRECQKLEFNCILDTNCDPI
jgi:ribosomal protein S2